MSNGFDFLPGVLEGFRGLDVEEVAVKAIALAKQIVDDEMGAAMEIYPVVTTTFIVLANVLEGDFITEDVFDGANMVASAIFQSFFVELATMEPEDFDGGEDGMCITFDINTDF